MRTDAMPSLRAAGPGLLLMACSTDALASEMAGAGVAALLMAAWGLLAVVNVLVTAFVVSARARRQADGAGTYLLVPLETALFTALAVAVAGRNLLDLFFLFAIPIPLAGWALAHWLHRERAPEPRYRRTRDRGRG